MDIKNVGGTPGGTQVFLLGTIMLIVGGYLLMNQVTVGGGYWTWVGGNTGKTFGLTLLPLLFGIGILFANGKSFAGRALTGGGALIILAGIIVNLDINFRQTTLFNTILMLVMIVGGLGLIARSVLPMVKGDAAPTTPDAPKPPSVD